MTRPGQVHVPVGPPSTTLPVVIFLVPGVYDLNGYNSKQNLQMDSLIRGSLTHRKGHAEALEIVTLF